VQLLLFFYIVDIIYPPSSYTLLQAPLSSCAARIFHIHNINKWKMLPLLFMPLYDILFFSSSVFHYIISGKFTEIDFFLFLQCFIFQRNFCYCNRAVCCVFVWLLPLWIFLNFVILCFGSMGLMGLKFDY
jgi:hypothetical protein